METTLDEPVYKTLWRDVAKVFRKVFHVLIPRGKAEAALRDWDLWGPLIFCLVLAFVLADSAPQIFLIVWAGAAVVTINSLLLGGKISFFQSVCLLGYCIFPLVLAAIVLKVAASVFHFSHLVFRIVLSFVAFAWATWASVGFFAGTVPSDRKMLAAYPVLLMYFVISWMVMVSGPAAT